MSALVTVYVGNVAPGISVKTFVTLLRTHLPVYVNVLIGVVHVPGARVMVVPTHGVLDGDTDGGVVFTGTGAA